jgi:hypothetical protein
LDEIYYLPLGPVVEMAGRIPEVAHVPPSQEISDSPDRLSRDRNDQRPCRDTDHLRENSIWVGHMFEDLRSHDEIGTLIAERKMRPISEYTAKASRTPLIGQLLIR